MKRRLVPKKRIAVVDDHPFIHQGMADVINATDDLELTAAFTEASALLEALGRLPIDALIVDLTLKDTDGLELLERIHRIRPGLGILVCSMHDEMLYAERVLKAGASGYLMKDQAVDSLLAALRKILAGEIYLSDRMTAMFVKKSVSGREAASPLASLSDRELEVLRHMGGGLSSREIAQKIGINIKTVDTYKARLKEKLGLANANKLMHYAVELKAGRVEA